MKRLGVFLLPPRWDASPSQGYPQHFASTHLLSRCLSPPRCIKCLTQEHNTMYPAGPQTWTTRSKVECTNHEATAPPIWSITHIYLIHCPDIFNFLIISGCWYLLVMIFIFNCFCNLVYLSLGYNKHLCCYMSLLSTTQKLLSSDSDGSLIALWLHVFTCLQRCNYLWKILQDLLSQRRYFRTCKSSKTQDNKT